MSLRSWWVGSLRLAPALAALACAREPALPHVLLISVDTLRADYTGLGGSELPTTPFLDALLADGVYFEQAVSPVPRTTPALASLLTGAYPHTTGVRTLTDRLHPTVVPVTEVLAASGYQTMAVVTNHMLGRRRGLARGFAVYQVAGDFRGARDTTNAALDALAGLDPARPVFAWIHYIDPHVPYHPEPVLAEQFDPGYRGPYRMRFGRMPGVGEPRDVYRTFPEELPKGEATHRNRLPERVNEHVRRLYAADIRGLDAHIERLVREFRLRLGDRLLIVFTADHGESLGEHGLHFDHGDYVYSAGTRVPLGFVVPRSHPARGKGRCRGWVSLVDVVPTLLDLLGIPAPPEMAAHMEGRSLAGCLRGETLPARPVFAESGHSYFPEHVPRRILNEPAGRFRAVILGKWKLVWTPLQEPDLSYELYDLAADPHETRDLYRSDHPAVAPLRAHLDAWLVEEADTTPRAPVSDEDRQLLRELGYLR